MHRDLLALIETAGDLATLPSTVLRLLGVLRDPAVSAHEVRAILEPDPAMATNLLKLANSAYYGHRRRIRTVQEALVLLGNRATATLAFATAMTPILRQDLEPYGQGRDEFWRHSLLTAQGAAFLMRADARRVDAGVAYTAGLIHDVGKLLVATGARRCGLQVAAAALAGGCERERKVLGFDHAEAGAALAEVWDLPEDLIDPVRHHHAADAVEDETGVVRAVAAADLLAHHVHALEIGRDGSPASAPDGHWKSGAEGGVQRGAQSVPTADAQRGAQSAATADAQAEADLAAACAALLAELGYGADIMGRFRQERAESADLTELLVASPA